MAFNYQAAVNITANYIGGSEIGKARRDIESLNKTTGGIAGGMGRAASAVKGFVAAFAISEAIQAAGRFAKGIVDLGDSMDELKQKTGIGVQSLLDLKEAAARSGVDLGSLESGLQKFAVTTSKVASGSKEAIAAFNAIGISAQQVRSTKPDQLIALVADRFSQYADGSKKAAVAAALFGRSAGPDLIPVLNQGSEAIKGLGLQMSDDFAARAGKFNDQIAEIGKSFTQAGINAVSDLLPALEDIVGAMDKGTEKTKGSISIMAGLGEAIRQVTTLAIGIAVAFQTAGEGIAAVVLSIGDLIYALGESIRDVITSVAKAGSALLQGDFEGALGSLTSLPGKFSDNFSRAIVRIGETGDKVISNFQTRFEKAGSAIMNIQKRSLLFGDPNATGPDGGNPTPGDDKGKPDPGLLGGAGSSADKIEKELETIAKYQAEQQKQIELKKLELEAVNMSSDAYAKEKIAIEEMNNAKKATEGFTKEGTAAYMAATEEIIKQKQALVDLEQQQKRSFGAGIQAALKDYVEKARDTASQVKELFSGAFTRLEDALVDFVKTGKLNFADLASYIQEQLIRIAIRQAILAPILGAFGGAAGGGGGFGFANGGIMTAGGPVPLKAYANGGVAHSPQLALFGEGSKPEAYVPLPDGRSIPVTMQGAGGGATSVVVNVNVQSDGSSQESSVSDEQRGKELGRLVSATVKSTIVNELRPGGLLAARG